MKFSLVSLSLLLLIAACHGVQLNTRVRGKTAFEVCGEQPHDIIVSAELPIPSATGRHAVSGYRTYALPPNRVYVCNILTKNLGSDPRVIVFKNNEFVDTTGKIENSVFNAKTLDYLATLYADSDIPHQSFLWAVDPNYNLIVAPEFQPSGAGTSASPKVIKTMKHGDLLPGFTPFQGPRPSRDDFGSLKERLVAGKFRGPAVMGGEFKELPSHAGWEINDASSYSILRVPLSDTALMYQKVNPATSKFWASSSRHIDIITKAQLHNLVCALQAIGFDSKVEHVANNVWDATAKKFNPILDDGGYAPAASLVSKYCTASHVSAFTGKPLHITYQTELH